MSVQEAASLNQFKHDVRSPLSALKTIIDLEVNMSKLHNEILTKAVERIEHMVLTLADREHLATATHQIPAEMSLTIQREMPIKTNLYKLITESVNEKMLEHPKANILTSFKGAARFLQTHIQVYEFKRVLSNLLNNSLEACDSDGFIKINISEYKNNIKIEIIDNGHGIPTHLLSHVTTQGQSFNKPTGTGLGLFHARRTVLNSKGKFFISSAVNIGTKIKILLPTSPTDGFTIA